VPHIIEIRCAIDGQARSCVYEPRDPDYQHSDRIRTLTPKYAAMAAIGKAAVLALEVLRGADSSAMCPASDLIECQVCGEKSPPPCARSTKLPLGGFSKAARKRPLLSVTSPTAWTVDSGSEYDVISASDLTADQRSSIYNLDKGVPLITAAGPTETGEAIDVDPFRSGTPTTSLVLEGCPPILSLGKLCMEKGFSFAWAAGKRPEIRAPSGKVHRLQLEGRVPVLPMPHSKILTCSSEPSPAPGNGEGGKAGGARGSSSSHDVKVSGVETPPNKESNGSSPSADAAV